MQIDWSQMRLCASISSRVSTKIAFVHDQIAKTWPIIIIIMQSSRRRRSEDTWYHAHTLAQGGSWGLRDAWRQVQITLALFGRRVSVYLLKPEHTEPTITLSMSVWQNGKCNPHSLPFCAVEKSTRVFIQSHHRISEFVKLIWAQLLRPL